MNSGSSCIGLPSVGVTAVYHTWLLSGIFMSLLSKTKQTGPRVAQDGFNLFLCTKMTSSLWSSCPYPPHCWDYRRVPSCLAYSVLRVEDGVLCMAEKSTPLPRVQPQPSFSLLFNICIFPIFIQLETWYTVKGYSQGITVYKRTSKLRLQK